MKRRITWFGLSLIVALMLVISSLPSPKLSWAQGGSINSVSTAPSSEDTILRSDLSNENALPYLYLNPVTAIDITVNQTASWHIEATVLVSSWPNDAPHGPEILEMQEQGSGSWQFYSGIPITISSGACSTPPCSESINVEYRLDLRDFGDGDSGDYSFNVTFELYVGGISIDSDSTTTITIHANAVVDISISSDPDPYNSTIDREDLEDRYFDADGIYGGFTRFTVKIYAISNYAVTASATVSGGSGYDPNGLLEIDVAYFSYEDAGCMSDSPGWQEIPSSGNVSDVIFTGCNTINEADPHHYALARLVVRMDLDNLNDSSSSVTLNFQITITITET